MLLCDAILKRVYIFLHKFKYLLKAISMDVHRTKYRFWPVNYLASRTKDARSICSNRELKNS